jgi:hypothetical protein
VGEDINEVIVIRRLPAEVRLPLLSGQENRLHGSSTPVCLDPAFPSFVHRASPKPHLTASQSRVGQFKHDAANVLVFEEIVPRELHFIEKAVCVEKEWIGTPTKEKTAVAGFRHQSFSPDGDRRILDHNLAIVSHPSGSRTLNTAQRRGLIPISRRRELHAVSQIGNCIALRVNLEFV